MNYTSIQSLFLKQILTLWGFFDKYFFLFLTETCFRLKEGSQRVGGYFVR